ncbi:MAG: aspartyl protease family protein [Myxococcota bacterium]
MATWWIRFGAVTLALAACNGGGDDPSDESDADADADADADSDADPVAVDLDGVVAGSHDGVPVELERTNHVSVEVSALGGAKLHFFVDSGASTTVLTEQTAAALGISGPLGTPVQANGLTVGGYPIAPTTTVILDLDATNAGLSASGEQPIDGILGAPFLNAHAAVLSYPDATLYLSDDAPRDLGDTIADALDAGGYDTIDASVNLVQFVAVDGALDGAPVSGIVDTGAGGSLVELAAATRLGLTLEPAPIGAATIGGAVDTYQTTVGEFVIGADHTLTDRSLLVVDLGGINSQLGGVGLPPIEILVGGDVLIEQDAVLDYNGERLFLRPE